MTPHAQDLPPTIRRSIEEGVLAATHEFLETYLHQGAQVEQVMALTAPEATMYGAGADEEGENREQFEQIVRRDLAQYRDLVHEWEYRIQSLTPHALSASAGLVHGKGISTLTVGEGEVVSIRYRLTYVFRLHEGRWKMAHGHVSRADSDQPEGESFPLDAVRARNEQLERLVAERTAELEQALGDLRAAQAQLVHQEKMVSLGQLTAGIAHEIKNPLNFVTNFASLSQELLAELATEADPAEREALLSDLGLNVEKIEAHGRRADAIVRSMMEHARSGSGERRAVALNDLVREYAAHAEHAVRARHEAFEPEIEVRLAPEVGEVKVVPQEIGRVLVNLIDNALDATRQRAEAGEAGYVPTVTVSTRRTDDGAEVEVSDNGPGLSAEVQAKAFEPFFTTKPTGEGTGLGLSISYDIVTQGHGGTLNVASTEDEGATFTVRLPDRA